MVDAAGLDPVGRKAVEVQPLPSAPILRSPDMPAVKQSGFQPDDGGSTPPLDTIAKIIWETEEVIVYKGTEGKYWRYMKGYRRRCPIEINYMSSAMKPDEISRHPIQDLP
jgi:hypothetical protein